MAIKNSSLNSKGLFLFFLLITFWVLLSVGRTIFNFSKVLTEEVDWIKLTNEQKGLRIFGKDFLLFKKIKSNHPKHTNVLIYSEDLTPYYYGRYALYPTLIFHADSNEKLRDMLSRVEFGVVILYKQAPLKTQELKKLLKDSGKSFEVINYE